jgi:tetratricopeptide (TPR) repeat protein
MSKPAAPQVRKAMISSTARDLPEHRKQVQEACARVGVFAEKMMENLTAENANAVEVSLRLVDEADVYIGIFAFRYGFVPDYDNPTGISITEMEYNRAEERDIPRLIFFMHDDHDLKKSDVETGPGADKLEALKKRIGNQRVAAFFQNKEDLRGHVIQALTQLKNQWEADAPTDRYQFHPITIIPELPAPYIAHPYVLSQAKGLVGRRQELGLLTDWIRKERGLESVRILNVVAIGGMGKSALTWEWFQRIAPQEWPQVQGRVWWSFYESDARFENFVLRTLAYLAQMPLEAAQQLDPNERENRLLQLLDTEPHLLVLDGFERELVAYTRLDANRIADDDFEVATANHVAGAYGLPASAAQSFTGQHRLRLAADRRTGLFLRRLRQVRASRILVTTRLYPFDLQMNTGSPLPGCFAIFLTGLSDDDALQLWRDFGVSGSRDMLDMFHRFGSHPLLLQALAGEVARYRPAPGDYDAWKAKNPDFNPFTLDLVQAKTHVMHFALHGLTAAERQVLHTIAAFRMPTSYETLLALCAGEDKPCADTARLDATLTELEDRGLLGWDRQQNRYDLHPVVRGVVWSTTDATAQRDVYAGMKSHFEAAPMIDNFLEVNSLEDLTPAIELYHALVGLGLLDEAFVVFRDKINHATLYRLSASRQRVELLEKLFPDGLGQLPRLMKDRDQAYTCNALALAYQNNGEPGRAVVYFKMGNEIDEKANDQKNLSIGLCNLSDALRLSGDLPAAEAAARRALAISQEQQDESQEGVSLLWLGLALSEQGQAAEEQAALEQSLEIWEKQNHLQSQGLVHAFLAQHHLWRQQAEQALLHANRAWELAHEQRLEADFIRAACRQGEAALVLGQQALAHERLHHALERARKVNFVEEELPALIALAELARQQGQPDEARELLEPVWEAAERGPYPAYLAAAKEVLARL